MKNLFKNLIEKIATENEKSFGASGKLDCCGLNKSNNAGNKISNKNS